MRSRECAGGDLLCQMWRGIGESRADRHEEVVQRSTFHRESDEESFRASGFQETGRDLERDWIAAVLLILFFILLVLVWPFLTIWLSGQRGYP